MIHAIIQHNPLPTNLVTINEIDLRCQWDSEVYGSIINVDTTLWRWCLHLGDGMQLWALADRPLHTNAIDPDTTLYPVLLKHKYPMPAFWTFVPTAEAFCSRPGTHLTSNLNTVWFTIKNIDCNLDGYASFSLSPAVLKTMQQWLPYNVGFSELMHVTRVIDGLSSGGYLCDLGTNIRSVDSLLEDIECIFSDSRSMPSYVDAAFPYIAISAPALTARTLQPFISPHVIIGPSPYSTSVHGGSQLIDYMKKCITADQANSLYTTFATFAGTETFPPLQITDLLRASILSVADSMSFKLISTETEVWHCSYNDGPIESGGSIKWGNLSNSNEAHAIYIELGELLAATTNDGYINVDEITFFKSSDNYMLLRMRSQNIVVYYIFDLVWAAMTMHNHVVTFMEGNNPCNL